MDTQEHTPQQLETGQRPERKPSAAGRFVGQVLSGSILTKAEVRRQYPFVLLLFVLMFLYIANGYNIQKLHRRSDKLTDEVKELRARSLTMTSKRMTATRQSEIVKELQSREIPLIEAVETPLVIEELNTWPR